MGLSDWREAFLLLCLEFPNSLANVLAYHFPVYPKSKGIGILYSGESRISAHRVAKIQYPRHS